MNAELANTNLHIEPHAFSKQSHQFWILQIAGWLGYSLVVFIAIIRPQFNSPDFNFTGQLLNLGIEVFSGLLLSFLQWKNIQKFVYLPLKKLLFISFTSAAVLGLIYNIIKLGSYKYVVYGQIWYENWNMLEFGGWFLFSVSTMFIWTAIFFIMLYNTKLQKEHEMLLRAQNSAKEAQLQMLRYQLNPHFMFNTMNAISTLIYKKDNDKAGEMLDKLCEFFRYSLESNTHKSTNLLQELELLRIYLSIEQVRFGERLSYVMDISPDTLKAQVPMLFLQPIVENAIKYAIEPSKGGGRIKIKAYLDGKMLRVTVQDNGQAKITKADTGFGIGLNNTKERLLMMFNGEAALSIVHYKQGTEVNLILPVRESERTL